MGAKGREYGHYLHPKDQTEIRYPRLRRKCTYKEPVRHSARRGPLVEA